MLSTLTQLVTSYGYIIVFLTITLESAGLPIPGETALLVAAAYASAGHLAIMTVIAVAATAAILGDAGGYWLGRFGGRRLLQRYGRWLHLDRHKLGRVERFFAQHGPKAVFFGRFISVLRTYSALFAGVSRMPYPTFTLFNALGGILWAAIFGTFGYVFGQNIELVEGVARDVGWGMLITTGLLITTLLAWRWVAQHQALLRAYYHSILSQPLVARLRTRYARQLRWLRQRLTPGEYLGLYLTLGLLAAAGCLWLFGGVTQDVLAHDPLVHFDYVLATRLHSWATPGTTLIFIVITELGSSPAVLALGVLVAALYSRRRQWLHLGTWLIALSGGEVLNQLLKHLFARPRPFFAHPLISATGYSFPSGHAMESLIIYGMLAYFAVLMLRTWRARTGVICASTLLVLLIGFSRLYLGVHYFSDVVGGFAAGGVWLSTCITGMEMVRRGEIRVCSFWPRKDL